MVFSLVSLSIILLLAVDTPDATSFRNQTTPDVPLVQKRGEVGI